MKVFIASLKYSPGHYSHLIAFYKLLEELNVEPYLYLDEKYKNFLKESSIDRYIYVSEEIPSVKPDLIIFYNASLDNHVAAKKFKAMCNCGIMYVYHEPWDGLKNYAKEGPVEGLKKVVANIYSDKLVKYCDMVLMSSKYALENYKKYESKINPNYRYFPLMFTDEIEKTIDIENKKYFSFIGNAVKIHQFKRYIDFLKYELKNETDYKFLIATRTNIDRYIDNDVKKAVESGKVKIFSGKVLTNAEINNCYNESFCVWNLYSRITQSGVLGKAFMFGTPVLASNIGSFPEFVTDYYNGITKSPYASFDEINTSILNIKANISEYSKNARKSFNENFYYIANKEIMRELIYLKNWV